MADQISDQSTTNLCFDIAGGTERGTSHQANQDTFFISDDQRLLIVTDGYSRSDKTSGAEAGRLAIESIAKQWDSHRAELLHSAEIQEWLQSSIQIANKILYAELMAKDINAFCATTVAVVSDHGSVQRGAHFYESYEKGGPGQVQNDNRAKSKYLLCTASHEGSRV